MKPPNMSQQLRVTHATTAKRESPVRYSHRQKDRTPIHHYFSRTLLFYLFWGCYILYIIKNVDVSSLTMGIS